MLRRIRPRRDARVPEGHHAIADGGVVAEHDLVGYVFVKGQGDGAVRRRRRCRLRGTEFGGAE